MIGIDDSTRGFYGGLVWYLETRNWAFEKMRTCPRGSHPFEIRMQHALYFVNLLSAIEHVHDHLVDDEPARGAFVAKIEGGIQSYQ